MKEKINFLGKVFCILEILAEKENNSLNKITKKSGLKKPTIYRVLQQLTELGYVTKYEDKYGLSLKFLVFSGKIFKNNQNIRDVAQKYMLGLRDIYDESINLALWDKDNNKCVLIETHLSTKILRVENKIGDEFSLKNTSVGKAIAANLPWETVQQIIEKTKEERHTEHSVTDINEYHKELIEVKENSYAIDNEETLDGTKCVGVPIFGVSNTVCGALSISSPSNRLTDDILQKMIKDLQIAGHQISFELRLSKICE
jgi:IclR family transcriptional regulator, KDG regulon repressor